MFLRACRAVLFCAAEWCAPHVSLRACHWHAVALPEQSLDRFGRPPTFPSLRAGVQFYFFGYYYLYCYILVVCIALRVLRAALLATRRGASEVLRADTHAHNETVTDIRYNFRDIVDN